MTHLSMCMYSSRVRDRVSITWITREIWILYVLCVIWSRVRVRVSNTRMTRDSLIWVWHESSWFVTDSLTHYCMTMRDIHLTHFDINSTRFTLGSTARMTSDLFICVWHETSCVIPYTYSSFDSFTCRWHKSSWCSFDSFTYLSQQDHNHEGRLTLLVAVCCSVLQCVAEYCRVLQSVAVCCSVLQCVSVRCDSLYMLSLYISWLCISVQEWSNRTWNATNSFFDGQIC